jgi:hypothetical protein
METSDWIALGALALAAASWLSNRRAISREQRDREQNIALLRRQVAVEGSADLVAENLGGVNHSSGDPTVGLVFTVRNVGRATARDISVDVQRFGEHDLSTGWVLGEASVDAALDHGERQRVQLHFPVEEARRGDLFVTAYWEDENGRHEKHIGRLPPQHVP